MITCAQKDALILGQRRFDPSVMAMTKRKLKVWIEFIKDYNLM